MKASEIPEQGRGLELLVEGLYGPKSRRWFPVRAVWHGNEKVNFSLIDNGWISYDPETVIETRPDRHA